MAVRYSRGTSSSALQARLLQQQQREKELQDQKDKEEADAKKKKRTTTIVIIIIAIIVLVVVGVVLYFFVFKRSSGTTTNTTTGQTTTGTVLGGACQNSNTCATNLICSGGFCKQQPQSTCTTKTQCPINYDCIGGKCEGQPNGVCSNNNDCEQPLVCASQSCQVQTCSNQGGCTHGGQCNGTKCLATISGYCTATADCAPPYECDTTTNKCIVKQCPGGPTDCKNITPLPGADPNTAGFCSINSSPAVCTMGPNAPCVDDQQCDTDPLDTPAGKNAIQKCDPAVKECRLLGGVTCNPSAPIVQGKCLNGDVCVVINPVQGYCSCNASDECNQFGPTPACDTLFHKCSQCFADSDCKTAPHTKCNTLFGIDTCVLPCTTNADCTEPPYTTCNTVGGFCM